MCVCVCVLLIFPSLFVDSSHFLSYYKLVAKIKCRFIYTYIYIVYVYMQRYLFLI